MTVKEITFKNNFTFHCYPCVCFLFNNTVNKAWSNVVLIVMLFLPCAVIAAICSPTGGSAG